NAPRGGGSTRGRATTGSNRTFPGKARAGDPGAPRHCEGKAYDHAPERDAQAQPEDLLLLGAERDHQKPNFLKISRASGLPSQSMNAFAAGLALAVSAIG